VAKSKKILFNSALIADEDLGFLKDAIVRNHISGCGHYTDLCEQRFEELFNARRVLLTTSCTHALELAATLLDLCPGDEVIIPSYTFVSTASAFALHNATPVFVDVDPTTLSVTLDAIRAAVTPRTRAICVVHYGGISSDIDKVAEFCRQSGFTLIEDNAHGLNGLYGGRPLGSFGDMSVLSFHETKNITSGEGGALVINDQKYVNRAEILREKGTNRSQFFRGQVDKYTWLDVGSSWVMSDMLAGILWGQLNRIDAVTSQRIEVFNRYLDGLGPWASDRGVRLPIVPEKSIHPGHLFHLRFDSLESRQNFISHMAHRGISTVFHYQSLAHSPAGTKIGRRVGDLSVSIDASETLVRLPLHLRLSSSDCDHVVESVKAFR
jgi:dTDP-4-amino-4,6-dideoxygalactose transaminase